MADTLVGKTTNGGKKKMGERLSNATVVALCVAVATGSWALKGEIDNFRLREVVATVKTLATNDRQQDLKLMEFRTIQIDVLETLIDIKDDLSTVSSELRAHNGD